MIDARYTAEIDEIAHTVLYSWRYNPKGEFGALYLSSSPECCWREKLKQVQGRASDLPTQAVGRFDCRLSKCLDLTDAVCCKTLGIALKDLIQTADFTMTQNLARQARRSGFEAIIAPSAIGSDCRSLVVFKDKLASHSHCTLMPNSIKTYP
jgi:hypothetical protein